MPRQARPWFRMYSESLDNRKLQLLPDHLFRAYINLLSLANRTIPRGYLPRMEDVAYALRLNIDNATAYCIDLRRLGFLEGTKRGYQIHDWADWQPDSDANLTPGRYANALKPRGRRGGDAGVARGFHGGDQIRSDKDKEERRTQERATAAEPAERDPPLPFEPESEKPKRGRKRLLTEDDVTDELIAKYQHLDAAAVWEEYDKCQDYILASAPKWIDQVAAFRNWLRRADEDARKTGTRGLATANGSVPAGHPQDVYDLYGRGHRPQFVDPPSYRQSDPPRDSEPLQGGMEIR